MNLKSLFGIHEMNANRLHSLALENSSTCFMIADNMRNIVYANKSVLILLANAEVDIRNDLPQFSVDKVVGSNIDIFHKNPVHQQRMLERLSGTHTAEISVGGRIFKLVLNPLVDNNGQQQGTSVEWYDITQVKKQEILTAQVVTALGATSSNIMVADPERNIVYMNKAVENMLKEAESDLKTALPHFSVDKVLGSNIDIFHKNPAHQSHLLANLKDTHIGNIVVANRSFRLIANPIITEEGKRLGSVVEWLDRTKEVAAEHELSRILGALDTATTNVMIADNDRKIIYMNKSVEVMLRLVEAEIKQELPQFSVDTVVGSNIDIFHKNPAHQMNLLAKLTKTYVANIKVGRLRFRLIANPIFTKGGDRIGSVVEWLDRTQEVFVEQEISQVVSGAALGDFTARIDESTKKDFFLTLAEGLNSLLNTTESGLNDITQVLRAISQGDMTERVTADYQGTFEELKDGCNDTAEKLSEMLGQIREAAATINDAATEIAQGNADLSSRTEEQASSLEETASSMEELTGTVRLNSENATQANSLASEASTVAIEGGNIIAKVVDTMSSIDESARKISDIIGVIDGIAFQTNILALNAAVEAARAGEQGRGFAVVASEVRTLAQRSANAAKDIKELISDSVNKVEAGNVLVNQSGDTMDKVVTSIKRVNDIMSEIAAASAEQATGIDEIGKAVTQMDEVTQQNAALVEEAAAAAESLQSQSEQLATRVSAFKLDDSHGDHRSSVSNPKKLAKPAPKRIRDSKKVSSMPKKIKPALPEEDEWESF
jgi:methyl-accepting chemotaxis protein